MEEEEGSFVGETLQSTLSVRTHQHLSFLSLPSHTTVSQSPDAAILQRIKMSELEAIPHVVDDDVT